MNKMIAIMEQYRWGNHTEIKSVLLGRGFSSKVYLFDTASGGIAFLAYVEGHAYFLFCDALLLDDNGLASVVLFSTLVYYVVLMMKSTSTVLRESANNIMPQGLLFKFIVAGYTIRQNIKILFQDIVYLKKEKSYLNGYASVGKDGQFATVVRIKATTSPLYKKYEHLQISLCANIGELIHIVHTYQELLSRYCSRWAIKKDFHFRRRGAPLSRLLGVPFAEEIKGIAYCV